MTDLPFGIETRGDVRVLAWADGSCRPATTVECHLWDIREEVWAEGRAAAYEEFAKDPRGLYYFAKNPYRVSEPVDARPSEDAK